MRHFYRASILAFAAFCATAALAQPKPALVQDLDQPGRAKYQEANSHSCQDASTCYFFFSVVPAGKRLVVTWVNVNYGLSASGFSWGILFQSDASGVDLSLVPSPDQWADAVRTINSPVLMYVDAGYYPAIEILNGGLFSGAAKATLVGYYISVP